MNNDIQQQLDRLAQEVADSEAERDDFRAVLGVLHAATPAADAGRRQRVIAAATPSSYSGWGSGLAVAAGLAAAVTLALIVAVIQPGAPAPIDVAEGPPAPDSTEIAGPSPPKVPGRDDGKPGLPAGGPWGSLGGSGGDGDGFEGGLAGQGAPGGGFTGSGDRGVGSSGGVHRGGSATAEELRQIAQEQTFTVLVPESDELTLLLADIRSAASTGLPVDALRTRYRLDDNTIELFQMPATDETRKAVEPRGQVREAHGTLVLAVAEGLEPDAVKALLDGLKPLR